MRYLAALPLCLALAAHAQNWALLNPAYRYNYSNDGTDTISNQIRVMQVDTLGPDSFRYVLNTIGVVCDTCAIPQTSCPSSDPVFEKNGEQFMGGMVSVLQGSAILHRGTEHLLIPISLNQGATWTGPGGIVGSVFAKDTATILNAPDSITGIAFSTGDTLFLSKGHGVAAWRNNVSNKELIGINGTNEGKQFPDMLSLFDYWPGDVLEYHSDAGSTDGTGCEYHQVSINKYTVLSRTDSPGRSDYQMRRVGSHYTWASTVWGGGPCTGSPLGGYTDTIQLGIVHAQWTNENFLGDHLLNSCWPGALDTTNTPHLPGTIASILHSGINFWGRYQIDRLQLPGSSTHTLCPSVNDDSTFGASEVEDMRRTYEEGVGYTATTIVGFEYGFDEYLYASIIRGVPVGTISSDVFILSTPERMLEPVFHVTPTPANERLTFPALVTDTEWLVLDVSGRTRANGRLGVGAYGIDVQALDPGAYVLHLADRHGQRSARFIIAR
ncbi:MAG: T9SS type A sorting domain-containing protein [Flavobacteriales bacterium]|nr:T9SS type A sorting domain-containing protein [Flavobacteriales bacterium]